MKRVGTCGGRKGVICSSELHWRSSLRVHELWGCHDVGGCDTSTNGCPGTGADGADTGWNQSSVVVGYDAVGRRVCERQVVMPLIFEGVCSAHDHMLFSVWIGSGKCASGSWFQVVHLAGLVHRRLRTSDHWSS